VLVQRHQCAEDPRSQNFRQHDIGGTVSLHDPVRHHGLRGPFRPDLFLGFAESQRLRLGKDIRRQDVVMVANGVETLGETDEVDRYQ
jgi:hypothetical protein